MDEKQGGHCMKIVLLSGKPHSGKTATFNILYDRLIGAGAKIDCPKKRVDANSRDFECTVIFRRKKIALFSLGDYLWLCVEAIIKYARADVLILAYSDRFNTKLNAMIEKYGHHVVAKTASNDSDCEKIISLIEEAET
jgi:hypothetical protein